MRPMLCWSGRIKSANLSSSPSLAYNVIHISRCSSSPAAGHVIHPGATEQNDGCCCKISGRKLFSHFFQWFSFRPVLAVISQQNLILFCSIAPVPLNPSPPPSNLLILVRCWTLVRLRRRAAVIKSAVPVKLSYHLTERRIALIPCTSECVYQSDGLCTLDSAAAAGVPSLGGACVHFIPAKRLESPHRYSERAAAAGPDCSPGPGEPEPHSV